MVDRPEQEGKNQPSTINSAFQAGRALNIGCPNSTGLAFSTRTCVIKAEVKGVITQVLVENAKPVEFGQPMFKARPA